MSLSSFKANFPLRPSSVKQGTSPSKPKTQSVSSDLFTEFETFRAQIKREYNEKMFQPGLTTFQDNLLKSKSTNISNNTILGRNSTNSTEYSTQPLKSTNKENIDKGRFIEIGMKKGSSQIENLKKSLKELSARKPDKTKETLANSLHYCKNSEIKRPSDFKSLLSNFENTRPKANNMNFDAGSFRFGTSGALTELENRAKLMIPSPSKRGKTYDLLSSFESSAKKIRLESGEKRGVSGKWDEKKIMMKAFDLQENLMDLSDQEFNECSNQYINFFLYYIGCFF